MSGGPNHCLCLSGCRFSSSIQRAAFQERIIFCTTSHHFIRRKFSAIRLAVRAQADWWRPG
jgi:hypothetical protein